MNGVSIIIPAYNSERIIGERLSATTNLTWTNDLEIIVAKLQAKNKKQELGII